MRKSLILLVFTAICVALASCSSKMGALSASNFTVTPNPLETQGDLVPATISGMFPEKYMQKNAVVTVTPELRATVSGTKRVQRGESTTFQGEKVMGNDQTISYRLGGRYTMKTNFNYEDDYQKSDMYLTFNARIGSKKVSIPDVKVASGVLATSQLYKKILETEGGIIAPDSFERVKAQKQEANIKFLVNQATVRQSELSSSSVKEFVRMLKKINDDRANLNLRNVEIQAYASPEGGFSYNDQLANQRQNTTQKYVEQQLNKTGVRTGIDAHYTAQDWEGFQQLVQASNIQDKDVILRVLSMYKDPQQREEQIRNMSQAFQELANGVLPELRRSRLIINYETIGKSDDEIRAQYAKDPALLSVDEMLYYATLPEHSADEQEAIYKTVAKYYDRDYRAFNNLAAIELAKGNEETAKSYLAQAQRINPEAAEAFANYGLINLKNGNLQEAENDISRSVGGNGFGQALGILNIAKGNYAQAEQNLEGVNSNSAALAQLLNKNYAAAATTLDNVKNANAMTDYLHAVVAARRGNKFAAESYLKEALAKDPSLKTYADNDLEFSILK